MKTLKVLLVGLLLVPFAVLSVLIAKPASAMTDNLGNLIVLNGLYSGGGYGYGGGYGNNLSELAGLIAVNNATTGGATAGTNSLGNLIVLNGLFSGGGYGGYYGGGMNGLAGLIAVNNITGGHY